MKAFDYKTVALIAGALVLVLVAMAMSGIPQRDIVDNFLGSSVRGPAAWRQTLREMTPLLIAGTSVFLALRAGLFNIGADGQLVVGAAAATAVSLKVPGVGGLILGIFAAAVFGALWAFPAAWIKAKRGGHEVISTIMLNNVAGLLATWLTAGPLRDPSQQSPTTRILDPSASLPKLIDKPPFSLSLALPLAVVLVAGLAFWLKRTVGGYELSATGANPSAASVAGVDVGSLTMKAMSASGAIAGVAGAVLVFAFEHRFYSGFSPGYGFDGLGVALLSGGSPWGLVPASLLFAIISTGSSGIQLAGVPQGVNSVLLSVLILLFACFRYRRSRRGEF